MSTLTFFYGFWEYWELYHKVTFDGVNKLILINPGETTVDVQEDIYSAWKQWMLLKNIENFRYLKPIDIVGGEPLPGDQALDSTFFLINGWKIKPYPGSYTLNIVGNVFDIDGGSIKTDADTTIGIQNNIAINTQTSAVVRRIQGSESNVTASLVSSQAAQLTSIENTTNTIENTTDVINTTTNNSYNQILSQSADINDISGSTAVNYNLLLSNSSSIQNIDTIVTELQSKLDELWQVHGLKIGFPVNVTQTARTIVGGTISQSFSTLGSGSLQNTTVTRTS
jgi:hypothetical protein